MEFEITNWRSFYRLLGVVALVIFLTIYTFYLIYERPPKTGRIIVWGIACMFMLLDVIMNLLFQATNIFDGYDFPVITDLSMLSFIAMLILVAYVYMVYYQWSLACVYMINDKTIPLEKQTLCQKGSAILMYVMLSVHFILYGMFFRDFYGL